MVIQPIISWKATKLYILCTTQFTKTANKSFFFSWMVWFWGISLSLSWPGPADTQEITMISLTSYVSACPVQPVHNRSWTKSTNLLTKTKKNYVWCNKVILVSSSMGRVPAEFSRGLIEKVCGVVGRAGVRGFPPHRKLSSVATKEKPLKALLALALAVNSGVRLTEPETISRVNSGSMCWVSAGPLWGNEHFQWDLKKTGTKKTHLQTCSLAHHVWVVRRSDSFVVKVVPVDWREKDVVLYF